MKLKELEKEIATFNKIYEGDHKKVIYIYWEAYLRDGGVSLKTFKKQVKSFGKEYLDYVLNTEVVDEFKMTRHTQTLVPVKRIYIHQPDTLETQLLQYIVSVQDLY